MADPRAGTSKRRRGESRIGLTRGPISRALFTLAWPVVLSNLLQTIYNIADTYWVGGLGSGAVAAISLGFPVVFLFISLGGGLVIAGTTLVAQNVGAGRDGAANYIASQTLGFVGMVSIVLAALGYFFSGAVVEILGAEPEIIPAAVAYLKTWFVGVPFVFGFFVFQALVRGSGNTMSPMRLMVASTLLNIVLDPFFIYGWGPFPVMGVPGAAVATVISRGLAAILGLYLLFKGTIGLRVKLEHMWPRLDTVRSVLSIGTPAAIEQSSRAVGMTVMTAVVTAYGTPALAAFGIGNRVVSLIFMPSMGVAEATTAVVGQNLGAGLEKRAEKAAWIGAGSMFALLSFSGIFVYAGAGYVGGIFLPPGDTVALAHTAAYLRTIAFGFGFIGAMNVVNGAFRGAGKTMVAMAFSIISLLGLRVPLAYFLAGFTELGTRGLWWGVLLSNVIGGILATAWFSRGGWKQSLVEDEDFPEN
ncbi:MAG: MATE family efflux transporter [Bacillota bacterium]